jgi:heat shock protein HtpX
VGRGDQSLRIAERVLFAAGITLALCASIVLRASDDPGGLARALGVPGIAAVGLAAIARAARMYTAATRASIPSGVGRTDFQPEPSLRARMVVTVVLALGIPLAVVLAIVVVAEAGWIVAEIALAIAGAGLAIERRALQRRGASAVGSSDEADALLGRLCISADMPVPTLVVEQQPVATAWTSRGAIHVTTALLELLDSAELQAVLAHELVHLAHRDAAVMDVATAPSQALLGGVVILRHPSRLESPVTLRMRLGVVMFGVLYVPPALVLGWLSRLAVLDLSRARELSADAGAAALTGRPSALASALLKLDGSRSGIPRADLRAMDARGALSIIEIDPPRLGRLLRTHPPVRARVERLQQLEARLQRRPGA